MPLLNVWRLRDCLLQSCLLLSLGCAAQKAPQGPADKNEVSEGEEPEGPRDGFEEPDPPAVSEDEEGPHPLLDGREPEPAEALPRLSYRHLGMHIGGPDNSALAKRPWLSDIESWADAFLSCYALVESPTRGGSYGVDLYVDKQGTVEVRASRQKLGGEEFDACMKRAFSEVPFHKPKVPTVLSYSILFIMSDPGTEPEGAL